ncbi:MAG: copper chaperone PCu(A)C [Alphaproteobacteria bacterium]|nr:copper chaperone PCu(A)C [Alphaproteobacteria bacterium]
MKNHHSSSAGCEPRKAGIRLAVFLVGLIGAFPALADIPVGLTSAIRIESPTVIATCKGAAASLGFIVANDSSTRLHLAGLSSNVAPNARLKARIGASDTADLGSINIPPESRLDLLTSHLRYEIAPLTREIRPGEIIEVQLDFVSFKAVVPVHVHEPPKGTRPCAQ